MLLIKAWCHAWMCIPLVFQQIWSGLFLQGVWKLHVSIHLTGEEKYNVALLLLGNPQHIPAPAMPHHINTKHEYRFMPRLMMEMISRGESGAYAHT